MQGHKITDEQMNEIRAKRKRGVSVPELAKEYKVHISTLYSRLNKNKYHVGGSKIKRARKTPKVMSVELTPPKAFDKVVVLLVDPKQLSSIVGDIYANR